MNLSAAPRACMHGPHRRLPNAHSHSAAIIRGVLRMPMCYHKGKKMAARCGLLPVAMTTERPPAIPAVDKLLAVRHVYRLSDHQM